MSLPKKKSGLLPPNCMPMLPLLPAGPGGAVRLRLQGVAGGPKRCAGPVGAAGHEHVKRPVPGLFLNAHLKFLRGRYGTAKP